MTNHNIEVKARIDDHEPVRRILRDIGADFRGTDQQIDTYYRSARGRLKVRQGTIENCIVWYRRPNTAEPKQCDYRILTFPAESDASAELAVLLGEALETVIRVECREIYFLGNIKIHLDSIEKLGCYLEIEAIGSPGMSPEDLQHQCEELLTRFEIPPSCLVECSYADLAMEYPT